jgi:hypothetical protein
MQQQDRYLQATIVTNAVRIDVGSATNWTDPDSGNVWLSGANILK